MTEYFWIGFFLSTGVLTGAGLTLCLVGCVATLVDHYKQAKREKNG